jgi:rSAM/selenodomain-associated transferase 1
MAKAPRAGLVKTRLAEALGADRAAALYRAFLADTLEMACEVRARRLTVESALCFSPPDAAEEFGFAAGAFDLALPQRDGDLGAKLAGMFDDLLDAGRERVIAIGADSPTLPPSLVATAFERLEGGADVVLGPTADGGYYLVGLRKHQPELFVDVPWSTDRVLGTTLERSRALGLETVVLDDWYDVDTTDELSRLRRELTFTSVAAPYTRAALAIPLPEST